MTDWFKERFISRTEHQQIVEYYRKLVADLHVKLRKARSQVDAAGETLAEEAGSSLSKPHESTDFPQRDNIILVDFRHHRRN